MTWSTGFFRLWIVLTALWMAATFAAMGKDEFKGLWAPKGALEVVYKGDIKDTLDSAAHDPDFLRHQIIEGVKRGAALLQRTDPSEAKTQSDQANTTADELLKVLADENQGRADRLYKGLELLLVPPVGLLIFGGVIAWVAAGFRKVTEPGV
jgi:hypothetical protein